jgi:hypothetical protein
MKHLVMSHSTHWPVPVVIASSNAFRVGTVLDAFTRDLTLVNSCSHVRLSAERTLVRFSCSLSCHLLLNLAVDQSVDPVVLKRELVGIEAFGLSNHLKFLIVVRSASVSRYDCPFEVRVLEVHARVVFHGRLFALGLTF